MAYEIYINDMLLPLPPEKIPIKYNGQNKTVNLINGEEINLIKPSGLAEISLDVIIPQMEYPCATWDGSFANAEDFLDKIRKLKDNENYFEFTVIREGVGGNSLFDTTLDVTLEDYKVTDDVSEGFDLLVALTMKEYKNYGTKIMNFKIKEDELQNEVTSSKAERQGEPLKEKEYTVVKGDCLWSIAKRRLGDGSRWNEIYQLNRDKISNPNLIYPNQVLIMP